MYKKKTIAIKQGRSEDYLKAGNENFEDFDRVKLNEISRQFYENFLVRKKSLI